MWRLSCATLRERNTLPKNRSALSSFRAAITGKRSKHDVSFQLDYYMSSQYAGVANAIVNNLYADKGLDVSILPTCPVGKEQENVRKYKDSNPSTIVMGSVEQNIFVPTLMANPMLKTTAISAMFAKSPLCIVSLKDSSQETHFTISAHEDTVDIMKRIFPSPFYNVVASPRATKVTDLISGKTDSIQAYDTTEVPTLRRNLHDEKDLFVTHLEGFNDTKLGYSQVMFAADECLEGDQREIVRAFCEATFDGWNNVIRDPKEGIEVVAEAKKLLGLDDESNDHWHPSVDFQIEMLQSCNNYVKETFQGDRYGVIDAKHWNLANEWLLHDSKEKLPENYGLDTNLWKPPKNLIAGNSLARTVLEDAKTSAKFFKETYGRKPSLAVITVGDLKRYKDKERRLQLYSNNSNSWHTKTSTGEKNGFDVQEINLDSSTTTDELLSQIYALSDVDGIQLMYPLPDHIDTGKVYSTIDVAKDVDGIHYIGQLEIGNKEAYPPVTPAATIALIEEYGINPKGKRVLVIGRSPIVGSPIAHMIRERGAAVTTVHSEVPQDTLKEIVGESDIIICCAGLPGLVKAEWIKGAEVINVGTTFQKELDSILPDVEGDIAKYAKRYSPTPGGVGPLSAPILFKNVAQAAWDQMATTNTVLEKNSWKKHTEALRKSYHFDTYTEALNAAKKVDELSTTMDHHANLSFTHSCVNGVDLEMEFFTFEAKKITEKDYIAAKAVDELLTEIKADAKK